MIYIYQHRRKDTGVIFYVGIGTKNRPYSRSGRNIHWQRIAEKAGFDVEIVQVVECWEQACAEEIKLIAEYGRVNKGQGNLVNMTDGGDGILGLRHSEKSKQSMSAQRRNRKLSEHQKQRISEGLKGKAKSEAHKQKLAESKLGKPLPSLSDEHKCKIAKSKLGKPRDDVADRNRQRPNPIIGKIFITDGTVNKMIYPYDPIPAGWYKGVTKKQKKI